MDLGEASAEVDACRPFREGTVPERIEGHDITAGSAEEFLGLGIPECERPSPGDRHNRPMSAP